MQTEKQQQHHEEQFLVDHAARETSLSWLNTKSLEFSAFYGLREVAVKSGDVERVLAAERDLDARRRELILAITAELQRVARTGGGPREVVPAQAELHQEEPEGEPPGQQAAGPLTPAERTRRWRENSKQSSRKKA
jgi:hypothetical protein